MAVIGILGVGGLAQLMVRGWAGLGHQFILSPRGANGAAALAQDYGCEIAASNQAVLERADMIFVSLPVAGASDELTRLRFHSRHRVLSAVTGLGLAALRASIAPATGSISMMPGYANAYRLGPCLIHPADDAWGALLGQVGPVHVLDDEDQFTTAASFGAFSGASVAFMAHMIDWFIAKGLPPDTARALVAGTLRGNAEVVLREPRAMTDIAKGVTTPGGITLQLIDILNSHAALDAWDEGMNAVLARIRGA